VDEFLWIEFNLTKIDAHALSTDEVEHAWRNRLDLIRRTHPVYGEYWESLGECPSGRRIRMIWRYNGEGETRQVFVITAY
jgi:hypothetical protein